MKLSVIKRLLVLGLALWLGACDRPEPQVLLLKRLDRTAVKLPSASSKVPLIINYWASWCKPCTEEIPELNRFAAEAGAQLLGVNYDALGGQLDLTEQREQARQLGIQFDVLDGDSAALLQLHFKLPLPQALPTTYIVVSGRLAEQLQGPQTEADLRKALQEVVHGS